MPIMRRTSPWDNRREPSLLAVCAIAMILAGTCAFVFGLVGTLNLAERILLMFSAAALAGGTLYTVLMMHRRGKRN